VNFIRTCKGDYMRLNQAEVKVIKQIINGLDVKAEIYLFGSRVHDHKKGGDIDLFIKSEVLNQSDVWKIKEYLWDELGEQKIDIIIGIDENTPFLKVALKENVKL